MYSSNMWSLWATPLCSRRSAHAELPYGRTDPVEGGKGDIHSIWILCVCVYVYKYRIHHAYIYIYIYRDQPMANFQSTYLRALSFIIPFTSQLSRLIHLIHFLEVFESYEWGHFYGGSWTQQPSKSFIICWFADLPISSIEALWHRSTPKQWY